MSTQVQKSGASVHCDSTLTSSGDSLSNASNNMFSLDSFESDTSSSSKSHAISYPNIPLPETDATPLLCATDVSELSMAAASTAVTMNPLSPTSTTAMVASIGTANPNIVFDNTHAKPFILLPLGSFPTTDKTL